MLEVTTKDTIPFVLSEDSQKRLQGEYWQARIRYENLLAWGSKNGFSTTVLKRVDALAQYLHSLRIEAAKEGVALLAEYLVVKENEPCKEDLEEESDEDDGVDLDCIAPGMNKLVEDFFDVIETLAKTKGEKK